MQPTNCSRQFPRVSPSRTIRAASSRPGFIDTHVHYVQTGMVASYGTQLPVAEAFTQLLRRGTDVREPAKWVWRSAFKIAGGELQRRRRQVGEPLAEPSSSDPESMIDLHRAIATLSPSQRAAVVLHDYAGYTASESARIVGSTEAAMRVHLMRGRRRLRLIL